MHDQDTEAQMVSVSGAQGRSDCDCEAEEMKPTIGSLFAGIGGIDLGFERAGFKTAWQVEIDPYCRKILARHFPDAERFEDVRTVGKHNLSRVDIITGGFPCQDISIAGDRAGIEDGEKSSLWRDMHRIICELRPRFVFVENVAALLVPMRNDRGQLTGPAPIARVLGDLAGAGYDAEWTSIWASSVGSLQRRERVFIVAYDASIYGLGRSANLETQSIPREPRGSLSRQVSRTYWHEVECPSWGMADGVPDRLDQLRTLGNAVVPQIPELIAKRIMEAL